MTTPSGPSPMSNSVSSIGLTQYYNDDDILLLNSFFGLKNSYILFNALYKTDEYEKLNPDVSNILLFFNNKIYNNTSSGGTYNFSDIIYCVARSHAVLIDPLRKDLNNTTPELKNTNNYNCDDFVRLYRKAKNIHVKKFIKDNVNILDHRNKEVEFEKYVMKTYKKSGTYASDGDSRLNLKKNLNNNKHTIFQSVLDELDKVLLENNIQANYGGHNVLQTYNLFFKMVPTTSTPIDHTLEQDNYNKNYAAFLAAKPSSDEIDVFEKENNLYYKFITFDIYIIIKIFQLFLLMLDNTKKTYKNKNNNSMDDKNYDPTSSLLLEKMFHNVGFIDFATDDIWNYDPKIKDYFKIDNNGNKIYSKNISIDIYINKKNASVDKLNFAKCLVSGDDIGIKECLDIYKNKAMWEVAEDEIKMVPPRIIKQLFKKLKVYVSEQTLNNQKINVACTPTTWRKFIKEKFDKVLSDAILSNDKLLSYVDQLINITRKNPVLLNPEYVADSTKIDKDNELYYGFTGLRFSVPEFEINDTQYPYSDKESFSVEYNTPYVAALQHNAFGNFVNLQTGGVGGIYGNPTYYIDEDQISKAFGNIKDMKNPSKLMYYKLKKELQQYGIEVNEEDDKYIEKTISKISEYDIKLYKLFKALEIVLNLSKYYNIPLAASVHSPSYKMIKIGDINSIDDIKNYLEGVASKLNNGMNSLNSMLQPQNFNFYNKLKQLMPNVPNSTLFKPLE
jgi:hypothetical protein